MPDVCGVCEGDGTSCLDCLDEPNGGRVVDLCGVCLHPNDAGFNQSCVDCAGTPNGNSTIDLCGFCLDPEDPARDTNCTDCNGVPNGPTLPDACGVCFGDNSTCTGCDGVPNSGTIFDECGVCLSPQDPAFDQSCVDCAGVPNGDAVFDLCGVCAGDNTTCLDCNGVFNGTAVVDKCGKCLEPDDPHFNKSCEMDRGPVITVVVVLVGSLLLCIICYGCFAQRKSCDNKNNGYKKIDSEAPRVETVAIWDGENPALRRRGGTVQGTYAVWDGDHSE